MAQVQMLGRYGAAVAVVLFLILYFASSFGIKPQGLDVNQFIIALFGAILAFLTNSGKAQE